MSGFYNVETSDGTIYECRGRGVFRKQKITPLVGDFVKFKIDARNKGYIKEIAPRKNELIRPPVANIDQAIIVASAAEPIFSQLLLDRFLVSIEASHIKPLILISKIDLIHANEREQFLNIKEMYKHIGYPTILVSMKQPKTLLKISPFLHGKTSVIAGQSGVGKSSILNGLDDSLLIETGEISKSLGRGKHTTRHVELINVSGGRVADTPGFSSLEFTELEKEALGDYFPEIRQASAHCRFRSCLHDQEPHCAIKQAVVNRDINEQRYDHYLKFLDEIKRRKPRY